LYILSYSQKENIIMKKPYLIFAVICLMFFLSCSEEKKELKIESLSAFAYFVEDSWELDATAVVSGFTAEEDEKSIKLSYSLDFVSPSGKLLEEIDYGTADQTMESDSENAEIDIQVFIGNDFETGDYKLIVHVTDDLSSMETSDTTTFVLEGLEKKQRPALMQAFL
jgi:hypothetical protein